LNSLSRIEGAVWVLENHRDFTPKRPHLGFRKLCDIPPTKQDFPGIRPGESHDGPRERSFPAAGFTHKTERRAWCDAKVDTVNSTHFDRRSKR
jgi:hypothetical protein